MIGQPIALVYPPDKEAEHHHIIETLKRGESIHNLDTVRIRKNGEPIQVSVTLSPIMDANGNPIGVSNVVRDITEKKRAERELEDTHSPSSGQRWKLLLTASSLSITKAKSYVSTSGLPSFGAFHRRS